MLTKEQYQKARADLIAFELWRDGRNSYLPEEVPAELKHVDNAMRSAVEVYEFMNVKPDRYFLYITRLHSDRRSFPNDFSMGRAITWTGEKLGDVSFGRTWRDNFGGKRTAVTIRAINGERYSGTYYESSGDFARVKKLKRVAVAA